MTSFEIKGALDKGQRPMPISNSLPVENNSTHCTHITLYGSKMKALCCCSQKREETLGHVYKY